MQLYTETEEREDLDSVIVMHVLIGNGCCFIWFGEKSNVPLMGSLCVATLTPYDTLPVTSTLLRDAPDNDQAQSMAIRLASRTGQQIFVSSSLPVSDGHQSALAALEKRVLEKLSEPH